jgi:conjugative relaxase-like TrwC/TraI family protein
MLSIGKLGAGQQSYYLDAVADGAEDYYVHRGEAPGRWTGGGAAVLGLGGVVSAEGLSAALAAQDPSTGEQLGRPLPRRGVPGFDLTFSAPKSMSVLAALGTADVADRVRAAHDAAVLDALAYLERTAGHGRRGRAGAHRILTSGFVAAAFPHRVSRAGDPHLHTHVVVANRVRGADGAWSALDARSLYLQAKTAGTLYQASLRYRTRELGLTWTVVRSGLSEAAEVPATVRRSFSRRRIEVEAQLRERGLSSAAAAQAATLHTRRPKSGRHLDDDLRREWFERCRALGFDPAAVRPRRSTDVTSTRDLAALLGPAGLTERASTFGERDVLRAVATSLPAGATVAQVECAARDVLASPEVVRLGPGRRALGTARGKAVPLGASEGRSTTQEMLDIEARIVGLASAGLGRSTAVASRGDVEAALARHPQLNVEQRHMVEAVSLRQDGVVVVEAPAGSGKTTALGAAVEALRASGLPVLGTTLSAKAAGVLRDETGLHTSTTVRFLADLRSGGLARAAVVVVDEAGQVGSRALAELLDAVSRAGGKLVLVGDPRQLPEIDAGGAYRGLLERLDVVRLTQNHRQRDVQEQARLSELRSGDVVQAMADYDAAGRVARAESGEAVRARLVADWADAYLTADGRDLEAARADVLMLVLTNADAAQLNELARRRLAAAGLLDGPEVTV